uniref:Uncharacterized protein n=1 Tax=Knipowitschia caucasica TaxID=637954 RepID=A0AAV2MR16_KNICA
MPPLFVVLETACSLSLMDSGSQLSNLTVLDLRHISELNNETVMEVVRKCRNLSSLNLCLNWSINDK